MVRDSDGAAGPQSFRDTLRARMAAAGADGAAPESDGVPAATDTAAPVQYRTDALWYRSAAGAAAAAPLKASRTDSQSDTADITASPEDKHNTAVCAAVSATIPATIAALAAVATPLQPAVEEAAAAYSGGVALRRSGSAALSEAAPSSTPDVDAVAAASASTNTASRSTATTNLIGVDSTSASLPSQAQPILPVWTSATSVSAAAPGVADPAPVTAPLPADGTRSAQGANSLVQTLGEHLQVQLARGSESAVIRLDPPSMGSIEIVVRHEAGSLQVHLNASNGEVLSQLQGIGEALRQDLMQRHQGSVSVQVSDDSNDAKERQAQTGGGREEPEQAPRGNSDGEETSRFALG